MPSPNSKVYCSSKINWGSGGSAPSGVEGQRPSRDSGAAPTPIYHLQNHMEVPGAHHFCDISLTSNVFNFGEYENGT